MSDNQTLTNISKLMDRITRLEQQIRDQWQQLRALEAQRDEAGRRYVAQVQECTDKDRRIAELERELEDEQEHRRNGNMALNDEIDKRIRRVRELEAELAQTKRDLHECGKYLADAKMDATGADAQRIEAQADNARLRECLKRLEWIEDPDVYAEGLCHACGRFMTDGHAPDCWLAKELEGE